MPNLILLTLQPRSLYKVKVKTAFQAISKTRHDHERKGRKRLRVTKIRPLGKKKADNASPSKRTKKKSSSLVKLMPAIDYCLLLLFLLLLLLLLLLFLFTVFRLRLSGGKKLKAATKYWITNWLRSRFPSFLETVKMLGSYFISFRCISGLPLLVRSL